MKKLASMEKATVVAGQERLQAVEDREARENMAKVQKLENELREAIASLEASKVEADTLTKATRERISQLEEEVKSSHQALKNEMKASSRAEELERQLGDIIRIILRVSVILILILILKI